MANRFASKLRRITEAHGVIVEQPEKDAAVQAEHEAKIQEEIRRARVVTKRIYELHREGRLRHVDTVRQVIRLTDGSEEPIELG